MAKKAVKKSAKSNKVTRHPFRSALFAPLRWFGRHWGKLLLAGLTICIGYSVYLDAQIKARFDGDRWQVPAQIYARPLTLYADKDLAIEELVDELALLSYRQVQQGRNSGEYSRHGQRIRVVRRAFAFPSGYQPEQVLDISFEQDKIRSVIDVISGKPLRQASLEPWLVTRLVSKQREDRMLVQLERVPALLTDTLLLVEDRDFYQHWGVNPVAIVRALVANIKAGASVQGGSTLTQQLVKNFFLTRDKTLLRKINEAWMSVLLEIRYDKDEILEAYLNEVYLGQNGNSAVHGFGLASHFYFDRPLNELDAGEVAALIGIVKGPSYYNPRRYPQRTMQRRDLILRLMLDAEMISVQEYKAFTQRQIQLADRSRFRGDKHPAYMDKVRRELALQLPDLSAMEAGVRVFTAMDPLAQQRAEQAVESQLSQLEASRKISQLQAALLVTDIKSGELRAIVGDRETAFEGFNRALDARRQVGSVIKPAVYLTALEQYHEYTLGSVLNDEPIKLRSTQGKMWAPQNADKKFRGNVPLVDALVNSLNVPTVKLGMKLGLENVADTLYRLGVEQDVDPYPAMTLGAVNYSPLMVNQMYQTIANQGLHLPLHALLAVTDSDNRLIWHRELPASQRFDPKAAYLLNYALHKVTQQGTAKQLAKVFPNVNLAGKTGTTDDYRDSWFSGFDRSTLTTVWVGHDDNMPTGLTGASGALQVFINYLKRQYPKSLVRSLPQGVTITAFDQNGQMHAVNCPAQRRLPAIVDELTQLQPCQEVKQGQQRKPSLWERIFGG